MLPQHRLPTQRTLSLLSDPVRDASPAKDMPTRRCARIFHRLQAQRALALLPSFDPAKGRRIAQIVSWCREDRGMCVLFNTARLLSRVIVG